MMARSEWGIQLQSRGGGKWVCSYKKITILVCLFNIAIALYCLRSLYASLYIYSGSVSRNIVVYKPDQIRKMEESNRIRTSYKPVKLMKLVKELEGEFSIQNTEVELPQHLKQKIIDEVLQRLVSLNSRSNNGSHSQGIAMERDAVENWRKEKFEEVKLVSAGGISNSTISHEEAGMLVKALESDWAVLAEEIGLWIPVEVVNVEHNDKPDGVEDLEEEVLPGRALPPECKPELHTDYDGSAVRWGLTHHKDSAADCCQACLDHAKRAKEGEKKCNIWVYCPSEFGCHSPDIYQHKHMECWLKYVSSALMNMIPLFYIKTGLEWLIYWHKHLCECLEELMKTAYDVLISSFHLIFAEKPKLNFKDRYPEWYRNSRPSAPVIVPWASGVVAA